MSDTEDSRAASLGRKRRQNTDVLQSAHEAEKRRKLDQNANFVALDSDDNSEAISEDRESGEVSSGEDSGDTSEEDPDHNPPPAPEQKKSPQSGHGEHPSQAPAPSPNTSHGKIDIDAVFPPTFQKFVREQIQQRDDLNSVEDVLAEFDAENKPYRKSVRDFSQKWQDGYQKYLSEYNYRDLQRLVQDKDAFRQPLKIQPNGTKKANYDFNAHVLARCENAHWKPCAEVVFDLLTHDKKTHCPASKTLKNYLDANLLPSGERKESRPDIIEIVDTDNETSGSRTNETVGSRTNIHLSELSKEELREQALYADLQDPADLVRCLSCGDRGHMKSSCPAHQCSHCGSKSHFSRTCPSHQKCSRCRQRGHRATVCNRGSKLAGGIGDECDVCGERGHAEEECSGIWLTFKPTADNINAIPEDQMVVSCYNCGRATHWGDDCPALPDFVADFITYDTWSAKNARRYISGGEHGDAVSAGQDKGLNGQENGVNAIPQHQVAMLGDWV